MLNLFNHDYIYIKVYVDGDGTRIRNITDSNDLAGSIRIEHWIDIHFGSVVIYIFQLAQCGYRLRETP